MITISLRELKMLESLKREPNLYQSQEVLELINSLTG
jgi:hypothetical protein